MFILRSAKNVLMGTTHGLDPLPVYRNYLLIVVLSLYINQVPHQPVLPFATKIKFIPESPFGP